LKSKNAKDVALIIEKFMIDYKLTFSDINRGLVVLQNLETDYGWKKGTKKEFVKQTLEEKVFIPATLELSECST
jgi:hypothetical protein